mgnify:CR=1 FL=1
MYSNEIVGVIVAPYMGAWIEMTKSKICSYSSTVAPYMGAWIEIFLVAAEIKTMTGRTLHGCVD